MMEKLKMKLLQKLGIWENRKRLEALEHRFQFLAAYTNLTMPEKLEIDPEVMEQTRALVKENFGVTEFSAEVHKNDVMFTHHIFHNPQNAAKGVWGYFRVGMNTAQNLAKICSEYSIQPAELMDFGSGYGRVSRFFPMVFPDAAVTVTEVKKQAVEFQQQAFGFEGMHHGQDPVSLEEKNFDLIFALSVFTHLPQLAFEDWMFRMVRCLNPGGALVFTYNDLASAGRRSGDAEEFFFLRHSEDQTIGFVTDALLDTQDYGSTFVSEDYLRRLTGEGSLKLHFLGNQLVPNQKAAMIYNEGK